MSNESNSRIASLSASLVLKDELLVPFDNEPGWIWYLDHGKALMLDIRPRTWLLEARLHCSGHRTCCKALLDKHTVLPFRKMHWSRSSTEEVPSTNHLSEFGNCCRTIFCLNTLV